MTSMPASRKARAITLAPRSCPSRPGLATSTRIFTSAIVLHLTTEHTEAHREWVRSAGIFAGGPASLPPAHRGRRWRYMVFTSKLRDKYQHATDRYGSQHFAIFSICSGLGSLRFL